MASERQNRRKSEFRGVSDPRCYVAPGYPGQFFPGDWHDIHAVTGWRPSRAVVVHRSGLDAKTIEWLKNFDKQ